MQVLSFDLWGQYAHFKKIYATTTAISYVIPSKTALYGYVGAIVGLEKRRNKYLEEFAEGSCSLALQIVNPLVMQRVNVNLRPSPARFVSNHKPTMTEYVYRPRYRVYFHHQDTLLYKRLKGHLETHTSVYTPTLGLSYLLSNFAFNGELEVVSGDANESAVATVAVHSVIPKTRFHGFDTAQLMDGGNEVVEVSMYALEMDAARNVRKRDDILLDRNGKPIWARVTDYHTVVGTDTHVMLL